MSEKHKYSLLLKTILESYMITPSCTENLNHGIPLKYKIKTAANEFVLTLHPQTDNTYCLFNKNSIVSKQLLINYLEKSGFIVPASNYSVKIFHYNEESFICTLQNNKEGLNLSADSIDHIYQTGKLMVHIHSCLDNWLVPNNFTLTSYNKKYYKKILDRYALGEFRKMYNNKSLGILYKACELAGNVLFQDISSNSKYGLIHGDLIPNNFISTINGISLTNFDFCGYGHRSKDIADILFSVDSPHIANAFLKGYLSLNVNISAREIMASLLLKAIEYTLLTYRVKKDKGEIKPLIKLIKEWCSYFINNHSFDWPDIRLKKPKNKLIRQEINKEEYNNLIMGETENP